MFVNMTALLLCHYIYVEFYVARTYKRMYLEQSSSISILLGKSSLRHL
jgi:hypothetical protein